MEMFIILQKLKVKYGEKDKIEKVKGKLQRKSIEKGEVVELKNPIQTYLSTIGSVELLTPVKKGNLQKKLRRAQKKKEMLQKKSSSRQICDLL